MKMRRMGLDTLRPGEQCVLRQIRLPAAQRIALHYHALDLNARREV